MSYAFGKILQKEFPTVFTHHRSLPSGLGPGWYEIIWDLSKALHEINSSLPHPEHGIRAAQVKEKFGELRYYWNRGAEVPDEIVRRVDQLVDTAARSSAVTCESCGYPGKTGTTKTGWVRTLCAGCGTREEHKPYGPED